MPVTPCRPRSASKERKTPAPESALVLVLDSDRYVVEVLPPQPFFPHRLLLRKESGREYTVLQTTAGHASCTCDGFAHGHWCRHLLGLEKQRLIECVEASSQGGTSPPTTL